MYMGKCYTIDRSNIEEDLIEFKNINSFFSAISTKFYDNGVYGVSDELSYLYISLHSSSTFFNASLTVKSKNKTIGNFP